MVAFARIMQNELANPFVQRGLPEEDHAVQAGLLDAANETLRVGVQIRDRGGSFTDFTPTSASIFKNSAVNSGSRSWMT